MGGRSGCAEVVGFFIMVVAIIAVFALVAGALGSSPVLDSTGLHWDNTGRDIRESNYTQRFVAREQGETERTRIFWDAMKGIAVAVAIAAVLIVAGVQVGRTQRRQAETKALLLAYVSATYANAQIEVRNGAKVLVDYQHREIVPISVIEQEMHRSPPALPLLYDD